MGEPAARRERRFEPALLQRGDRVVLRERGVPALVVVGHLGLEIGPLDGLPREAGAVDDPRAVGALRLEFQVPDGIERHAEHGGRVEADIVGAHRGPPLQPLDMRELVLEVLDQQRAGVRVVMLADVEPGALGGRRRVLHLLRVERRPVHHRQVVLLHRVLDVDLPVAVHLVDPLAHQREIVEGVGPHQLGEVAEVIGQRRRVVVEIDEDEAAAGLQPELRAARTRRDRSPSPVPSPARCGACRRDRTPSRDRGR